jgi:hypothetical protein
MRKHGLKFCFSSPLTAFAGAASNENKPRFATDSLGPKQKPQRIGIIALTHFKKGPIQSALLASRVRRQRVIGPCKIDRESISGGITWR